MTVEAGGGVGGGPAGGPAGRPAGAVAGGVEERGGGELGAPLLAVAGLEVAYGQVQVVWGVDLAVRQGQVVTLLGPNGAGKTTVLRAIAGLTPVLRGAVRFAGRDLARLPARERLAHEERLCLVPEGRQLWPRMTVEDNLLMGAYAPALRGGARGELRRVYDLFPRLAERRGQLAGTLSGGEQQLCAIGRGLMGQPRLLLLDEPSLGLAPLITAQIFDLIRRIASGGGLTVLLAAQTALQALEIADYGYVMETGRIVLAGAAGELRESRHVRAAYLGED
jgi:branched-chain amino acid transport system ATP-binding protein